MATKFPWSVSAASILVLLGLVAAILLWRADWNLAVFFTLNDWGRQLPTLAQVITHLGDRHWVTPILIILLASRMGLLAAALLGASCVHLLTAQLKAYFAVLRPCFEPALANQVFTAGPSLASDFYTFPSGHSGTAGLLMVLLLARFGNRVLIPAALLALAIALSRSTLGAHYPSDTFTGLVLGGSVGLVMVLLVQYVHQQLVVPRVVASVRSWSALAILAVALYWQASLGLSGMRLYPDWFKAITWGGGVLAAGVLLWQARTYLLALYTKRSGDLAN